MTFVVDEEFRELLLERFYLRAVADQDVWIVGIMERVVLMVVLCAIETLERRNLGDDGFGKDFGGIELGDVGPGDALLIIVHIKDDRAIGVADVGTLAVELRGIVGDGEKDAQQLSIGDLRGIVNDLDRFGVAGGFGRDLIVGCRVGRAASVANGGRQDALDSFKDGLGTPEASAGEDGFLLARR